MFQRVKEIRDSKLLAAHFLFYGCIFKKREQKQLCSQKNAALMAKMNEMHKLL